MDNGVLFNSDRQQYELDLWNSGLQMFAEKDVILSDLINKIDSLQNLTIESDKLRYNISVLHNKLQEPIRIRETLQLQCEEALNNKTLPKKYLYPAVYGLMTLYARKNQIAKAASFYELLKPINGDLSDEVMERRFIPVLLEVHEELDSLKRMAITDDERSYKQAKGQTKIITALTSFNDSYPDFSSVNKIYKQIITRNPYSLYADNAAYELLENSHRYHDMGDIEPVKDWEKWNEKYPNSELRPNAIIKLARYNATYFHEGENPSSRDIEKTQALLSSINPDSFTGQEQDSTLYVSLLKEVELAMFKAHIEVEILPKELLFLIDQPIVFTVRLKNKSDRNFEVDLFSEGSALATQLYNREFTVDSDYGDRIMNQVKKENIPAGEFVDLKVDLSKNTKIFTTGWVEGRYNIKETGIYFINFHNPNFMIGSQTKFEVLD